MIRLLIFFQVFKWLSVNAKIVSPKVYLFCMGSVLYAFTILVEIDEMS